MATSIFQLVGSILVDNSAANESLQKTDDKAKGVGTTLLSGVKSAGKFAAGLTAAASTAVAGITALASDTASTMDVIDKASQRMDISAESYQELSHAASLCGVEMSTMEKAAKKLEGTDMNLDDALEQIYALGTAEERSAMAAELFGDSIAYNLSPMLNATGEEMSAMRQEANDLGLVMDSDAVSAGASLNDALSKVKDSLSGMVTQLGSSLMPVVQEVCDFIIASLPTIQGLFDKLAPILINMFEQLMPELMSLAESLLPIIVDMFDLLLPVFSELCATLLPVIVNLIQILLPPLIQIVQALLPVIVSLLDALLPILEPMIQLLNPILQLTMALLSPLLDLINVIIPPLTKLITAMVKVFAEKLIPAVTKFVSSVVSGLTGAFDKVKTTLDSMKQKFVDIFNGIKTAIKGPINSIIGFINGLIGGVTSGINTVIRAMNNLSWEIPDWVPALGGKTFGFSLKELTANKIPLLAEGAVIEPNKPFAAVLGDQKNGTNIEAPLDTIKEAVSEVIANMGINVNVAIDPDSQGLFRVVREEARSYQRRTGETAFA